MFLIWCNWVLGLDSVTAPNRGGDKGIEQIVMASALTNEEGGGAEQELVEIAHRSSTAG